MATQRNPNQLQSVVAINCAEQFGGRHWCDKISFSTNKLINDQAVSLKHWLNVSCCNWIFISFRAYSDSSLVSHRRQANIPCFTYYRNSNTNSTFFFKSVHGGPFYLAARHVAQRRAVLTFCPPTFWLPFNYLFCFMASRGFSRDLGPKFLAQFSYYWSIHRYLDFSHGPSYFMDIQDNEFQQRQ